MSNAAERGPIAEVVEQADRATFEKIQAQVHEQLSLWRLIPQMIRSAEADGVRMDQKTRFCRRWSAIQDADENAECYPGVARPTDSCPEYAVDFWYVGKGGQGTSGRIGVSLETGDFVMADSEGPRTDFPIHLLLRDARERPEEFDAIHAITSVAKAIQRQSAEATLVHAPAA